MAARFWVLGTGNWSDTAHWSTISGGGGGSAVPTSSDDVTLDSGSGTAATITIDAAANANTITINKSDIILLHNFGLTVVSSVTLTAGTLNINGQTCSWGLFYGNIGNATPKPTLTMGSSAITITNYSNGQSWQTNSGQVTYTANTATLTFTGGYSYINVNGSMNGTSVIFNNTTFSAITNALIVANLTINCPNATTMLIPIYAAVTVTGTLTVGGYTSQGAKRLCLYSNVVNTMRTFTVGALVITGDVNFQDIGIAYSGASSWTNSGNAYIGNALGNNSEVVSHATPSATQTSTGTASFTWSTHTWSGRAPLPQDDVIVSNAFSAGRTITVDMAHIGRNIDFSSCTGNPAIFIQYGATICGSLTFKLGMTRTGSQRWSFIGRGSQTITFAGVTLDSVSINGVGGTYTLVDDVTLTGTGANPYTCYSNGTVIATNCTITLTGAASAPVFSGGGYSYKGLVAKNFTTLSITSNNTFGTLDLECTTAHTVKFPANGTQTVTGTMTLNGASGQLLSLVSSTPTTAYLFTITGKALADYTNITDCDANSGTSVWATHSTNGGNNHNVIFAGPTRLSLGGVG